MRTPVARSTESPTELMSSSPVAPCSGLNIATSLMPGALARISIVLRPSTSKPVWLVITPTARGEDELETRISRKPSCSRTSIPFITIPLCGAGPRSCAAICGRQGPSPEATLLDTPGCELADVSKAAMKVTGRTILAVTRGIVVAEGDLFQGCLLTHNRIAGAMAMLRQLTQSGALHQTPTAIMSNKGLGNHSRRPVWVVAIVLFRGLFRTPVYEQIEAVPKR